MSRILLREEGWRDGVYWHDGKPYSGVGFEIKSREDVRPYQLLEGKITGPYLSICEEGQSIAQRIELDGADCEFNYYRFDVGSFTGMGYLFDRGNCRREAYFEGGEIRSDASWRGEGMGDFYQNYEEFSINCTWHDTGDVEEYRVNSCAGPEFFIRFSARGWAETLRLDQGTVDAIEEFAEQAKFFPIKSKSALFKIRGAGELLLLGDGIVEDFLLSSSSAGVLGGTVKMRLWNKNLERLDASIFARLPNLKELEIEDDPKHLGVAQAIKRARPALKVMVGFGTEIGLT